MSEVLTAKDAYNVMLKEFPDVMDIEQMCKALGVSTKTGYRLLRAGYVQCLKVGRAYRIPKAHVIAYLRIGANFLPPYRCEQDADMLR